MRIKQNLIAPLFTLVVLLLLGVAFEQGYLYRVSNNSYQGLSEEIHLSYIRYYTELNNYGTGNESGFADYTLVDFTVQITPPSYMDNKNKDCIVTDFLPNRKIIYTFQRRLFGVIPLSSEVEKNCLSMLA